MPPHTLGGMHRESTAPFGSNARELRWKGGETAKHRDQSAQEEPWNDATVDRSAWISMEYVARVTWKSVATIHERAAPRRFLALFADMG